MKKNYNYTRRKLYMPEYGRHIHEMIDSLLLIEDRRERNRQARAVIAVMGNLFPLLRDTADYTHKLWDHLFIMSDFQLDVDSPYPRPTRQELTLAPHKLKYPQERVTHKHYGKYVGHMLKELGSAPQSPSFGRTVNNVAAFMRQKSYEYNQDFPGNDRLVKDIAQLSDGRIEIDEQTLTNPRVEHKQHYTPHHAKGSQQRGQRGPQKNRNQRQGWNYQKNGGQHRNSSK